MPPKKQPSEKLQKARGRPKKSSGGGGGSALLHDAETGDQPNSAAVKSMSVYSSTPTRGRPPKKSRKTAHDNGVASAEAERPRFIMKLFDRSLDVNEFPSNSALYPMCRAWMKNQPHSNDLTNCKTLVLPEPEKRDPHNEILDDLRSGRQTEVHSMPAILRMNSGVDRIPKPLPSADQAPNLDFSRALNEQTMSRDELLASLKTRSAAVRKNWLAQKQQYQEQTYGPSFDLLNHIYKPL